MNDLLLSLARSIVKKKLEDPATRAALKAYVHSELQKFMEKEAGALATKDNVLLRVLSAALADKDVLAAIEGAVDMEFDNLLTRAEGYL